MAGLRQQQFKIVKGLNQDIDIQSSNPEQAFRLFNIKNQTLDNSNSGNLTNEKGNSEIKVLDNNGNRFNIAGKILGIIQCTPSMAVIFTYVSNHQNIIYRVIYDSKQNALIARITASGDFGIPPTYVSGKAIDISGLFVYEHSELQKIYWVDGVNQLRYLNIADSYLNSLIEYGENAEIVHPAYVTEVNRLNSSPTFKVDHHIEVKRIPGGGVFSPGVIQWAFTYFNKYGAETNIVDMTPLYYLSEEDRGVDADKTVGCSYQVSIMNPDMSFDYIRIYSIQRNSLNGIPVVKIVKDIKLK